MTSADISRLYVDVQRYRCLWFMTDVAGKLVGHGVCRNFLDLRGVQLRAGVLEVILDGAEGSLPYDDWRHAKRLDRENLENLRALAAHTFAHR